MKKIAAVLVFACLLLFPPDARAQQETRVELFGGYSLLKVDPDLKQITSLKKDDLMQGWVASAAVHLTDRLAIKAEYLNQRAPGEAQVALFGPQLKGNIYGTFQPFAHLMAGFVASEATVNSTSSLGRVQVEGTAFAYDVGGGLDIVISRNFAVRAFQIDYLRAPIVAANQHNLRGSAGIVLSF